MKFYVFGSETSQDYDVFVETDKIPRIEQCKIICKEFEKELEEIFYAKKLNVNLCVIKDGYITDVHKGIVDECNNSLFYTYKHHLQVWENPIKGPVERNIDLKLVRALRIILAFLSKTQYRPEIKDALKSNSFLHRLNTLRNIDLTTIEDFGKKMDTKEVLKTIAFQIGQCRGLMDGKELYTKEGIIEHYESLREFLIRDSENLQLMNTIKEGFCNYLHNYTWNMTQFHEEFRK